MGGGSAADGLLFTRVHQFLEVHVTFFHLVIHGGGAHDGPAVHPDQELPLFQDAEVLADRHFRNAETLAEFGDIDGRIVLQDLENGGTASLGGIVNDHRWKDLVSVQR